MSLSRSARILTLLPLLLAAAIAVAPALAATAARSVDVPVRSGAREGTPRHTVRPGWPHPPPLPDPGRTLPFIFRIDLLSEDTPFGSGSLPDGRPLVLVQPGQRYTIRLHNPLPVRAAVNLTVDGLNTITGSPSAPGAGSKWVIEPHAYADIRGWQTGGAAARRFVFTSREGSYASWRSNDWAQDLSVNCGVIGAAYFWSSAELAAALIRERPVYPLATGGGIRRYGAAQSEDDASGAPRARKFEAGTGMAERLVNPVRTVYFDCDAGMFDPDDAVVLYYDFPSWRESRPRPFSGGRYAPEMPERERWPRD
jgi:hypothetical protein